MKSHFDITEVKDRVDIFDVLDYFNLGVDRVCKAIKSPLRDEKFPSFSIFAKGAAAKDHGTGESYDCISLYQKISGCDLHDAICGCAAIAKMTATVQPSHLYVPSPPRSIIKSSPVEVATDTLRCKLGDLTEDKLDAMKIDGLKFLDDSNNVLTDFIDAKKLCRIFMRGMIEKGMVGILQHPSMRSPAIAWIFHNRVHGYAVKLRFLASTSRNTMWWIGKSSDHFFGEQLLEPTTDINQRKSIFVTEGESDCLTLLQLGYPAIGVIGSGVMPEKRVIHISLAHKNVGVWYDNDKAGIAATKKIQDHIIKCASGVAITNGIGAFMPEGFDIGDCWINMKEKFSAQAKNEFDKLESFNNITTVTTLPT